MVIEKLIVKNLMDQAIKKREKSSKCHMIKNKNADYEKLYCTDALYCYHTRKDVALAVLHHDRPMQWQCCYNLDGLTVYWRQAGGQGTQADGGGGIRKRKVLTHSRSNFDHNIIIIHILVPIFYSLSNV